MNEYKDNPNLDPESNRKIRANIGLIGHGANKITAALAIANINNILREANKPEILVMENQGYDIGGLNNQEKTNLLSDQILSDKMVFELQNYHKDLLGCWEKGVPFKRDKPKIGRNSPCPCGSLKKYKHCCINKKEDPKNE